MIRSTIVLALAIGGAALGATIARADCESDLVQLEDAMKTPNLSADAEAVLDDAATKSVAAMKKDDDATCHQVIADAMTKAGLQLK